MGDNHAADLRGDGYPATNKFGAWASEDDVNNGASGEPSATMLSMRPPATKSRSGASKNQKLSPEEQKKQSDNFWANVGATLGTTASTGGAGIQHAAQAAPLRGSAGRRGNSHHKSPARLGPKKK